MIRHADVSDAPELERLYRTLTQDELVKRFFAGGCPDRRFFERWASLEQSGGLCLVAELTTHGNGTEIIGEAGYSPLADGDVELGIAVRHDHRGWTGAWLLDALFRHAEDRGFDNIQATIRTDNRPMMRLAAGHGCAFLGHPDWGTVHVTMGTHGEVPSWPPNSAGTRVLIESDRSRWPAEDALLRAGATVAICTSTAHPEHDCPLLAGERCPLVDGADVIIVDLPLEDRHRLELRRQRTGQHPDLPVIAEHRPVPRGLESRAMTNDIVDRVISRLGLDTPSDDEPTPIGRPEYPPSS